MAQVEVRTIKGSAQTVADFVKTRSELKLLHIHDDDLVTVKASTLDMVRAALGSHPEVIDIKSHSQAVRARRKHRREGIVPTIQPPTEGVPEMTTVAIDTYPGKAQAVETLLKEIPGIKVTGANRNENVVYAWAASLDEITIVLRRERDKVKEIRNLSNPRTPTADPVS